MNHCVSCPSGGLLLDQPGPAVVRVVREPAVPAGDRAGGAGWSDGALPRDAHVYHVSLAEDGHESRRPSTSA